MKLGSQELRGIRIRAYGLVCECVGLIYLLLVPVLPTVPEAAARTPELVACEHRVREILLENTEGGDRFATLGEDLFLKPEGVAKTE